MSDAATSTAATPLETPPKIVRMSLVFQMLLVPVVLAFLVFMYQPTLYPEENSSFFFLGVAIVASLALLGLITLLGRGYGWVKHLFAVSAAIRIPRQTLLFLQVVQISPSTAAVLLMINLWWLVAVGMLYAPSAQSWFRNADAQRERASNQRPAAQARR